MTRPFEGWRPEWFTGRNVSPETIHWLHIFKRYLGPHRSPNRFGNGPKVDANDDRNGWVLRAADLDQVRKNLAASLAERIAWGQMKREARWTESLAVGSRTFVEKVQPLISGRLETEIAMTADHIWALQEAAVPYGQQMEAKIVGRTSLKR
jgi:hypothetical protein